jgi:hypothetical protein
MIHGNRPVFSASAVLAAIAGDLSQIKTEDRLTHADLGRVLGKSEDQAAKYCEATAEMGVVAFAAAKREWNGRFTGALDRLCHESRPTADTDHDRHCKVLGAALALAEALRDDGEISVEEVRGHRADLEGARDAINDLLGMLTPRTATR